MTSQNRLPAPYAPPQIAGRRRFACFGGPDKLLQLILACQDETNLSRREAECAYAHASAVTTSGRRALIDCKA